MCVCEAFAPPMRCSSHDAMPTFEYTDDAARGPRGKTYGNDAVINLSVPMLASSIAAAGVVKLPRHDAGTIENSIGVSRRAGDSSPRRFQLVELRDGVLCAAASH